MKTEIFVKCNNGTKYRIAYSKKDRVYVLSYRNDTMPLLSVNGDKVKGKWLYLDTQSYYCDVLAYLMEEIAAIDAANGE